MFHNDRQQTKSPFDNIHKGELDEIDIKLITKEFIKIKESRIATFGLY